jgi:hypothetical protein
MQHQAQNGLPNDRKREANDGQLISLDTLQRIYTQSFRHAQNGLPIARSIAKISIGAREANSGRALEYGPCWVCDCARRASRRYGEDVADS